MAGLGAVLAQLNIARRSADGAAITANTVLANDDSLFFPINAGEMYWFETFLLVNAANATMDAKFGFSVPAGATMAWGLASPSNVTVAAEFGAVDVGTSAFTVLAAAGTRSVGTFAGTTGVILTGLVTASTTAGNVNLQVAQNTSDAGALKLLAGSCLKLWRVN